MSSSEDRIGLKSGWFLTWIPYSVSMPMTFGMAMRSPSKNALVKKNPGHYGGPGGNGGAFDAPPFSKRDGGGFDAPRFLQVLTRVDHPLDAALLLLRLAHQRLDVDDALALLAGDFRPVVGVGGVRQVLVLLELLAHGRQQVVGGDALLAAADVALERQLLGAPHDRLDHGARREVLEVQDLLVAVGVGDLEEAVLLAQRVHALDR